MVSSRAAQQLVALARAAHRLAAVVLVIFSTPSILGQPSWLVFGVPRRAGAVARRQVAIAGDALCRLESMLRAVPLRRGHP